jgi:hypothetical protein
LIQKKFDDPKSDTAPQPPSAPIVAPKAEGRETPTPPANSTDSTSSTTKDASKPAPEPPLAVASPPPVLIPPARPALAKKKKAASSVVRLFNGTDLAGFGTYLGAPTKTKAAIGSNTDPEHVFSVRSGELHISGKTFGGLVTVREYENYNLIVEFKWGEKRWPPREEAPRLSGIVLHATGAPGAVRGWTMAGIKCILSETDTGGILLPDNAVKEARVSVESERVTLKKADRTLFVYKPGEPLTTVSSGTVHRLGFRPPALAKAAIGKVAPDVIHPIGEWNTLEIRCADASITITLNGTVVNDLSQVSEKKGKIFFESEGAEIVYRRIELRPIAGAPTSRQ